jgi:hypothetical protein
LFNAEAILLEVLEKTDHGKNISVTARHNLALLYRRQGRRYRDRLLAGSVVLLQR